MALAQGYFPHLLLYKLVHAAVLADYGRAAEASKYAELVSGCIRAIRGNVKISPSLNEYCDSVNQRLNANMDGASSGSGWFGSKIGRPKLDRMWGQLDKSFTKFIAGDEASAQQSSVQQTSEQDGIFKRLASSPSLSQIHSTVDLRSQSYAHQYPPAAAHNQYGSTASFTLDSIVPSSSESQTAGPPNLSRASSKVFQPFYSMNADEHVTPASKIPENTEKIRPVSPYSDNRQDEVAGTDYNMTPYSDPERNSHNGAGYTSTPADHEYPPSSPSASSNPRIDSTSQSPYETPSTVQHNGPPKAATGQVPNPYAPVSQINQSAPSNPYAPVPPYTAAQPKRSYTPVSYLPHEGDVHKPTHESVKTDASSASDSQPAYGAYYGGGGYDPYNTTDTGVVNDDEDAEQEVHISDLQQTSDKVKDQEAEEAPPAFEPPSYGYQPDPEDIDQSYSEETEPGDVGQYYTPMSAPSFAPLISGSSSGTAHPPIEEDDDEDLGFSNKPRKSETEESGDEMGEGKKEKEEAKKQEGHDKKGWFGWLRKSDDGQPKAVKAKLGDENSFHFDPELKRWVNKNAPASEAKAAAAPPPPKMLSSNSRTPSAPPSAPPSAHPSKPSSVPPPAPPSAPTSVSPFAPPSTSSAPHSVSPVTPHSVSPAPLPPKVGISGGLDDLLAAAPAGGRKTTRRNARNRYVDIMSQDASK